MPQFRLVELIVLVTLAAPYLAWLRVFLSGQMLIGIPCVCVFMTGVIAAFECRRTRQIATAVVSATMIGLALVIPLMGMSP